MFSFSRSTIACLVLFASCLSACASTQVGTIAGPGRAAGASLAIVSNERSGEATLTLEDGQRCSGHFNTVPDQVTWDDERVNWIDSEDSRVGMAVVSCQNGFILRCDFAEEATGPGHGSCRDQHGQVYTLVL